MAGLIKMPGASLTPITGKRRGNGLAIINRELAGFAQSLAVAARCRRRLTETPDLDLTVERWRLDRAKTVHRLWLADYPAADAARDQLSGLLYDVPREPITRPLALQMLAVLFGALSKRRADDENAAMQMEACADLFNPVNDAVGTSTRLWRPASKHPLVTAVAIKSLIATSVFAPSPSELRSAMTKAETSLRSLAEYADKFVGLLQQADAIMFALDRASWQAAHASVAAAVAIAMRERTCFADEIDSEPDARWEALGQLAQVKAEEPTRAAACAARPAKRSSKPER
jgi:hypothetical protein